MIIIVYDSEVKTLLFQCGGGAWVQSMTEEVPHARNKLTNKIAIMSGDKLGKKKFSEP